MIQQWKLSEFNTLVAKWITTLFGSEEFLIIWEISKIKQWNSRFYIELIEYADSKVIAHAHALITNQSVLWKPLQERWLKLHEVVWQQILMTCSVHYHKDYGVQLFVHAISSEYTLGSIKKKTTNIKDELKQLGILYANKEKKLQFPPYHIAIVSSPSSEWLKDFLDTLQESGYRYSYELFDTAIHGNTANSEIHKTLQKIYERVKSGEKWRKMEKEVEDLWKVEEDSEKWRIMEEDFDLVVIVRGWGSSSGILWYNDIHIAKWICYMPIPVMMAVGHTSDQFLLDEIASYSAKTPTDAAYEIINQYDFYVNCVDTIYNQIIQYSQQKFSDYGSKLHYLYQEIQNRSSQKIQGYKTSIQHYFDVIMNSRPEKMLQSGYALLYDEESRLLKREIIADLQEWELIELKIYNRKIIVEVVSNRELQDEV